MAPNEIVQAAQMLIKHLWLAPPTVILWLFLMRVRTRVNIPHARDWNRASQDIGVPEDERRELFVNAVR